jgi:hypothetical protein
MNVTFEIKFCPQRNQLAHCWHQDPKPNVTSGSMAGQNVVCCYCGTKEFHANMYYNEPPSHGQYRPVW